MRYTKFITAIAMLFALSACTIADIDEQTISVGGGAVGGDKIQVVGRITRFDDHYVSTRAAKLSNESKVTCMALALFRVNTDGVPFECINYYFAVGSDPVFTVDRSNLGDRSDQAYAFYIFANVSAMQNITLDQAKTMTLADFKKYVTEVNGIGIPADGFPMIGSLGDCSKDINGNLLADADGKKFILYPVINDGDTSNINGLPTVDGVPSDLLNIPMKSLYAKMVFNIAVDPTQEIVGLLPPAFQLDGFTVNNVAREVDFVANEETEANTPAVSDSFPGTVTGNTSSNGPSDIITFSFYLPERLLQPNTAASEYGYPFGTGDAIRDEDKNLRQRYKPQLVTEEQKATYVTISGTFRDHQNHDYTVNYNIYVGEDNYGNFEVHRNKQYNNNITIRGIQNSEDQSDVQGAISIDHRVNIQRTLPAIINLRRETLLDSHFEVRPLRIRKRTYEEGETTTNVGSITVSVLNVDGTTNNIPSWIRLERSYGTPNSMTEEDYQTRNDAIYIVGNTTNVSANGKRKYFTYGLVSGKQADGTTEDKNISAITSVIVPLTTSDQTVWIYVDECTDTGDEVRSAIVRVSYTEGSTTVNRDYVINQRLLFPVTSSTDATRTYNVEYHEEYLYNYDADDTFTGNTTQFEGMAWGLDGARLSFDHPALYFKSKTGDWANGIVNAFTGEVPAYYDFYIKKHDETVVDDPKQVELHEYDGYNFCQEIISDINQKRSRTIQNVVYTTEYDGDINKLDLSTQPQSAIEYCYNKNKRNSDGTITAANVKWYLPAIDEIEDIVMSTYGDDAKTYARFHEFQDKYYWSCQPAYIQNYAHMRWTLIFIPLDYYGPFYYDDIGDTNYDKNLGNARYGVGSARATKVSFSGTQYNTASSATTGYYSYYEARSQTYSYSGTYNGVTIGTITRADGNKPRTDKARIRCVYKAD